MLASEASKLSKGPCKVSSDTSENVRIRCLLNLCSHKARVPLLFPLCPYAIVSKATHSN